MITFGLLIEGKPVEIVLTAVLPRRDDIVNVLQSDGRGGYKHYRVDSSVQFEACVDQYGRQTIINAAVDVTEMP